jgi:mannose-6-phosphate isomerase-like protein (cupin superfamily)
MDARTPLQPAVVTPKQALSIKPFGLDMDVLLTTEATGGATSVIVAWHKPGEGPPDHVHFKQEEILFIIEGLYEVTLGDETTKAGPGSIVFIPRNVVHRYRRHHGTHAGLEPAWWAGPLPQSDLGARRRRRFHQREGDGDQQDVRYPLPCRALNAPRLAAPEGVWQSSNLRNASASRQSDRITIRFAAVHLSPLGTKRTCHRRG